MTMHPYIGGLIGRERQRDMMAEADRLRQLGDLARAARRGASGRGAPGGAAGTWTAALLARLRPRHRAVR